MLNGPFSPWPSFSDEEANAVRDVLLSNKVNYWTGQECREFEREFAKFADAEYAIALANGTVALDLALKALGIGAGDEVVRSEEHTSELQSRPHLVCRLLLEKKKKKKI